MSKQKSLIGMQIDSCQKTIEASQLNRLNRSFFQPNSFELDQEQARHNNSEPFSYLPTFLLGNLINLPSIYKTLGLNINNVLLSRESVTCHHPIEVGDSLIIKTFLKDAYEQQATSNPIGFVILTSIANLDSEIAFSCERVIAVRGGFQRGRLI